jgi:hypothetical protein
MRCKFFPLRDAGEGGITQIDEVFALQKREVRWSRFHKRAQQGAAFRTRQTSIDGEKQLKFAFQFGVLQRLGHDTSGTFYSAMFALYSLMGRRVKPTAVVSGVPIVPVMSRFGVRPYLS